LVLVHGTTGSDFSWRLVEPLLAERFTLYLMQRRGRGESGDGTTYSLSREAEDVAAVVDSIEGQVDLFGHSYGAACALEAALIARNLRKMVLYEPGIEVSYAPGSIEEQERLAAEGRYEDLIEFVMASEGVFTPEELTAFKTSPTWPARLELAWTIPRESREESRYTVSPERFAGVVAPTLLLSGSESGAMFREAVERVRAALPHAEVAMLDGQGHVATLTAPDLVAREVSDFLAG
jgi:pimeloyl-ACP methyl ester carboxylesterase